MNIFKEICRSLASEKRTMLATIIATSGSTPAAAESKMIIFPDEGARAIGTVGGGCLDANIIVAVKDDPTILHARTMSFQLNDDTGDTGLNCGGTVTVFLEPLNAAMMPVYEKIVQMRETAEDCSLITTVKEGCPAQKTLMGMEGNVLAGSQLPEDERAAIRDKLSAIIRTETVGRISLASGEQMIEFIRSPAHVMIFGGGHVGKAVSRCAALAGFRITVVDDRRAFANKERFPEADKVLCESFEVAFSRVNVTSSTYVVIVTRGHRHDELVLEKALQYRPAYIGMIGSKRKVLVVFEHLTTRGVSPELLSHVHAPIGLSIGARTAEEIGVSVVAELIAVRRNAIDQVARPRSSGLPHL